MCTFRVMDRTGDTATEFDVADKTSLAEANARFKELTGKGFLAYEPDGKGGGRALKSFDPKAETTIFRPQLIGG